MPILAKRVESGNLKVVAARYDLSAELAAKLNGLDALTDALVAQAL